MMKKIIIDIIFLVGGLCFMYYGEDRYEEGWSALGGLFICIAAFLTLSFLW
jgi:hypothetical protein